MARKGTKIKRYGSIYGRNSGSIVIAAAMIIGLSLFAVAGWLLYTPIHDFVMNIGSDSPKAPASSIAAPVESQPAAPTAPVTSEAPAPAATQSEIKGIYIPAQALSDAQTLSATFENAVSAGFLGQIEKAKQSMQNF